jgi:ribonuclease-3
LFETFPTYLEGELTKIKSSVVSGKTCCTMATDIGIPKHLKLGKGMTGRAPLPDSLAAAMYEAVIGAMYLDGGLEPAKRFILATVTQHIEDADASDHQHNYKSQLQQHAQKVLSATPVYELLDEQGPDHSKCFEVCVSVRGQRFSGAWGPSKREAEQLAARRALEELDILPPSDNGGT